MRSWPPLEAAVLLVALAFASFPLYHFTTGRRPAERLVVEQGDQNEASMAYEVWVAARFAHPPQSLKISHLGKAVWEAENPEESHRLSGKCALPLDSYGIDLRVEVAWPAGTPESIVELTLEPEALEGQTRSGWGEGKLDLILTYQWPEL